MKPEIIAKILSIARKTGEKVIFLDPDTEEPYILMGLDSFEILQNKRDFVKKWDWQSDPQGDLTQNQGSGMIDPDSALLAETRASAVGEWGGDDNTDDDKFYMEPVE